MDLNGNGITVSNEIWEQMKPHVPKQQDGKPVAPDQGRLPQTGGRQVQERKASRSRWAWCSRCRRTITNCATGWRPAVSIPATTRRHKGDISGTINADALLSVTPPPQMPATLEAGTIYGYCVGEPWNQQAVFKGIGVPVITDYEIWKDNPEKVFGADQGVGRKVPEHPRAVVKALIRAAKWLDDNDNDNRPEAVKILSRSSYVGADYEVIANSMTGTFEYEKGDKRSVPDFNVFFRYNATYPYYSDAVWYLTQMRRWGQIAEHKPDAWYVDMAKKVYRPDIYAQGGQGTDRRRQDAARGLPGL